MTRVSNLTTDFYTDMLIKVFAILLLLGFVPVAAQAQKASTKKAAGHYECPMHPDVTSKKPGKCPKCQMALRFTKDKPKEEAPPAETAIDSDAHSGRCRSGSERKITKLLH